jgi:hypothetical protein
VPIKGKILGFTAEGARVENSGIKKNSLKAKKIKNGVIRIMVGRDLESDILYSLILHNITMREFKYLLESSIKIIFIRSLLRYMRQESH